MCISNVLNGITPKFELRIASTRKLRIRLFGERRLLFYKAKAQGCGNGLVDRPTENAHVGRDCCLHCLFSVVQFAFVLTEEIMPTQ